MSLWSQQHQHFSFFYPLIRTEHTSAADLYLDHPEGYKLQGRDDVVLLPAVVVWSALRSNNISEVSRSIIQTWSDLITLRVSDIQFYPPTQHNPWSLQTIRLSLYSVQSWVGQECQVRQHSNSYSRALLRTKVAFFFSLICLRPRMRHTWHVALVQDTCQELYVTVLSAECWPRAGGWWHLNNEKWEQAPCQHPHRTRILTWNFTTVNTISIFMFQFPYCYIDSSPKYLFKRLL